MFNVGGGELLAILVIALIVLGPSRLPDAARQIGKTMGDLRRLSTSFQNEVKSALDTADDPDRVASRRNVLAREESTPAPESAPAPEPTPEAHRPRRKPLVAAPAPDDATSPKAAPKRTLKAAPPTTAAPKNGTAVDQPAADKAPAEHTDPS